MKRLSERACELLQALDEERWLRPMDIGGRKNSHHSETLMALIKRGLAERQARGSIRSFVYRRTAAGSAALLSDRIFRLADPIKPVFCQQADGS